MKMNLRAKFLLIAFTLVVAGIAVLVTVNYLGVRQSMLQTLREDTALICRSFAGDISGDVAAKLQVMRIWAKNPLAAQACKGENVNAANAYLAEFQNSVEDVNLCNYWDLTGTNTACSAPANVGKINIADRDYFRQTTKDKMTNVLSQAVISKALNKPVSVMAQPVFDTDGKTVVGLMNANLDLISLTQKLAKQKIGQTGYFIILDKSGLVLVHPDPNRLMKDDIAKSPVGQRILAVQDSEVLEYEEAGAPRMAAVVKDKTTGWTFVAMAPLEDMSQSLRSVTLRNAAVALGTTVVLLAGIALAVGGFIIKPLTRTLAFASDVAAGKLDSTLEVTSADELGALAAALRRMVEALKNKIAEADALSSQAAERSAEAERAKCVAEEASLRAELAKSDGMQQAAGTLSEVVDVLTGASGQLSGQIETSNRGADEQARRVAETATAMEEMNATVLEVARNASEAAQTAEAAKHRAEDGARVVGKVVDGIGLVQTQALGLKENMAALGKQAEGIGTIMNVISDIADQTNLLALNAAIEAARAGEAGRGFAVVADEVRKLAEKTMNATKEVGEAIRAVQQGTRSNVEQVDGAVRTIAQATALAGESGQALGEIVTLVEKTSDQARAIATAAEQQSAASEEISHSIEDVNRISSQTADAMRQSAQAVDELTRQVQVLDRLIGELRGDGQSQAALAGAPRRPALT